MKDARMAIGVLAVILSLVSGCMSPADLRKQNTDNIMTLSVGMSKQQVLEIMGDKSVSKNQTLITNPYRTETKRQNDKTYEILYYYTHKNRWAPPFFFDVKESDLTPLFFLDGKLEGWGASFDF
jgi:hypothetical protein